MFRLLLVTARVYKTGREYISFVERETCGVGVKRRCTAHDPAVNDRGRDAHHTAKRQTDSNIIYLTVQ
jgi:hypothetical protein